MALPVTAADIDDAAERISGIIAHTPLQPLPRVSALAHADVWVKREDLQPVRSYKLRGAYNLIAKLDEDARRRGVVCASAGNHGQGVAFACARLHIHGRIVVPSTTPRQKRDRMLDLGGEYIDLVIGGEAYDDAAAEAKRAVADEGLVPVPAFDAVDTIAGQATLCAEIVDDLGRAPDVIVVPVGGGGLLAGVIAWFSERYPATRIVGVEPAGAPCVAAALSLGEPVLLDQIDTFIDGAAVGRVGDIPFAIINGSGADLMMVSEGAVCSEMLALYQTDGIIAEPAGALATAALCGGLAVRPGQTVVAIISGGNNDVSRYAEIVERALIHEGRKHYFMVEFPQEPGSLRRFLDEVLGPDDDITMFEYVKRNNRDTGPALVGIEIGDPAQFPALMARIEASPIAVEPIDPAGPFYRYFT